MMEGWGLGRAGDWGGPGTGEGRELGRAGNWGGPGRTLGGGRPDRYDGADRPVSVPYGCALWGAWQKEQCLLSSSSLKAVTR